MNQPDTRRLTLAGWIYARTSWHSVDRKYVDIWSYEHTRFTDVELKYDPREKTYTLQFDKARKLYLNLVGYNHMPRSLFSLPDILSYTVIMADIQDKMDEETSRLAYREKYLT